MNNKHYLYPIFFLFCFSILGQTKVWKKSNSVHYKEPLHIQKNSPIKFQLYSLDIEDFKRQMLTFAKSTAKIIELPTASGQLEKFSIIETSNIDVALAEKFPMIKSYSAQGIDDPTAIAKISLGTDGFHAVIFSGNSSTFYINPYTKNNKKYIAYKRADLEKKEKDFSCILTEKSTLKKQAKNLNQRNANDGKLRTYKLALACSGEYAQFHLNQQGVSASASDAVKKAAVLSAMNTSMTRVNGVFEKDLGVRMTIVANNDAIIFLDPATDGITEGQSSTMLNEVQSICDAQIGSINYDIGHLFSIDGDGLAGLGVVCVNGQKAKGVTGRSQPISDPYDIDFVAHEIGHQFGANHTQNNGCARNSATAVEPGSASTIMGYAGICGPNVQNNSDDHFHAVNIDEMWAHIQGAGNCATISNTGNSAPTAYAGMDRTIPKSTPFVLRGTATDTDGLAGLTYNWEQTDNEIATMPPVSTSTKGPAFRSLPSQTSPNRYMPSLATVVAGHTSNTWEVVPSVARELNFSLVVRDNHIGGGNSARDDVKITIDAASGPFVVTSQTSNELWNTGATKTITWDVAGTDTGNVNTPNVSILLSTDGGVSFPHTLATNVPNDGSQNITVPSTVGNTNTARVIVEGYNTLFYAMNSTNFSIQDSSLAIGNSTFHNFNLFPNPSKGSFRLNLEVENTEKVSVQLFDISGRFINKKDFFNTDKQFSELIEFDKISAGIYFVKIINNNKQATRKLFIE